jgi:hypothetical protein
MSPPRFELDTYRIEDRSVIPIVVSRFLVLISVVAISVAVIVYERASGVNSSLIL